MSAKEMFEKHHDEFLKFDRITDKHSKRADIHAFILLDRLTPGDCDMVSAAEHDEIWLEPGEDVIEKLTEEQVIELTRCGVRYSEDSLCMFV